MKTLADYPFLRPCFWSYRLSDLDIKKHQNLIIKQILNHGHQAATDWLRATYREEEIRDVLINSARSDWSPKSLTLWSLIYHARPAREQRFVEAS